MELLISPKSLLGRNSLIWCWWGKIAQSDFHPWIIKLSGRLRNIELTSRSTSSSDKLIASPCPHPLSFSHPCTGRLQRKAQKIKTHKKRIPQNKIQTKKVPNHNQLNKLNLINSNKRFRKVSNSSNNNRTTCENKHLIVRVIKLLGTLWEIAHRTKNLSRS